MEAMCSDAFYSSTHSEKVGVWKTNDSTEKKNTEVIYKHNNASIKLKVMVLV